MNNNMKDLFIEELQGMLTAEELIIKALPKMIKGADSKDLKDAFETHLAETKEQANRLKQIFSMLKIKPAKGESEAIQGLIEEVDELFKEYPASALRDAAIISKAQRIEHFEISVYGTLRTFAKELDLDEAASLLQKSLDEEANADKLMTKIAEGGLLTAGVNSKACQCE